MTRKLVIFGIGDIGELAGYLFGLHTDYEIVGFCVDRAYVNTAEFMGKPLVAFEDVEEKFPPATYEMFVAIGYTKVNKLREQKYDEAKAKGYRLASYISPMATVFGNVEIGDNCFIFEDNTLQPFVKIGNNNVLWSGNHVGHHTIIGNHCFITSHTVISGRCVIGDNCFIGVNATLRDHLTIGNHCVIGAGTVLLKDTADSQVFIAQSTEASSVPSHRLRGI
jgi:sugar O-acyltransferase (sialic acid O-acetyltransferase NeuD family)